MGYDSRYKGHHCLSISTGKTHVSYHVLFDEEYFPFALFGRTQEKVDSLSLFYPIPTHFKPPVPPFSLTPETISKVFPTCPSQPLSTNPASSSDIVTVQDEHCGSSSTSCSPSHTSNSSTPPRKFHQISDIMKHTSPHPLPQALLSSSNDLTLFEPTSYCQAKNFSH